MTDAQEALEIKIWLQCNMFFYDVIMSELAEYNKYCCYSGNFSMKMAEQYVLDIIIKYSNMRPAVSSDNVLVKTAEFIVEEYYRGR